MLNLFQADLPIGRRLWIVLLTVVLLGSLDKIPLTPPETSSVQFVIDILIFFGYIQIIDAPISLAALAVVVLASDNIWTAAVWRAFDPHWKAVGPQPLAVLVSEKRLRWLPNIVFLIAILIAAVSFGGSITRILGQIGIALLLLETIFDIDAFLDQTTEVVKLKGRPGGELETVVVTAKGTQTFTSESDYIAELRNLLDAGWAVVESSSLDQYPSAILRREYLDIGSGKEDKEET